MSVLNFILACLHPKGKDKMNTLSAEKKLAVIAGLVEGNSIRSTSRMMNVDRNTINSLLLRTGERCAAVLDERMRQLPCRRLQCDEICHSQETKRELKVKLSHYRPRAPAHASWAGRSGRQ
jgi:transposase